MIIQLYKCLFSLIWVRPLLPSKNNSFLKELLTSEISRFSSQTPWHRDYKRHRVQLLSIKTMYTVATIRPLMTTQKMYNQVRKISYWPLNSLWLIEYSEQLQTIKNDTETWGGKIIIESVKWYNTHISIFSSCNKSYLMII